MIYNKNKLISIKINKRNIINKIIINIPKIFNNKKINSKTNFINKIIINKIYNILNNRLINKLNN